jgi:hypothetical protein
LRRLALVAVAGCSGLLGLQPPHEQVDAPGSTIDAKPDAGPSQLHIIVAGTAALHPDPTNNIIGNVVTADVGAIDCTTDRGGGTPGTCDATIPPGQAVTLTANTADPGFTGFIGAPGCTGTGLSCTFTPTQDTTVYARWWGSRGNLIFVSSTVQHPGSFDSPDAVDTLCRTLADTAGVPQRPGADIGSFRAWLADSGATPRERLLVGFVGAEPQTWSRVDGALFASTFADVDAGHIIFPPRLDEFGRDVGDDALAVTDATGTGMTNSGGHCQDWASESASGRVLAGEPVGGTDRWTAVATVACNEDTHVYCMTAFDDIGIATAVGPGPIIWVSTGKVAGNAGVGAMDAVCQVEGNSHGFFGTTLALVTPASGQPIKSRFPPLTGFTGAPQRPDGAGLAGSMDALFAGTTWVTVPNVDADKNFVDDDVWTGAGGFDNTASDCNGWTLASDMGATRPAATTRDHSFSVLHACSESHRVMCFAGAEAMPLR